MQTRKTQILIIGGGPAGYTAALYAARANLKPVLLQGLQPGGQLTITTEVENWPGETSIMGPELVARMADQASHAGAELVFDTVTRADLSRRPFTITCDSGDVYEARTIVIATGATAKWLGVPGEEAYRGFGVSACATCDGFFFRDKTVAVVGGGNTAVEEALYLTRHAAKVILVHRRDALRAEKILQDRLLAHPKIEVVWNAAVEEILGNGSMPLEVTGLRLRDTISGEPSERAVDGVFVAIGHAPATGLFRDTGLSIDAAGYIVAEPGSSRTSIPGVFAAGDVRDPVYRQAVTAAGMGCMAAIDAERFLETHDHCELESHMRTAGAQSRSAA